MNDDLETPAVYEAVLSPQKLDMLFADLAEHTQILEVRAKAGPQHHARPERLSLEQARALLEQGRVRAIQLRYRHHDQLWMDTLIAQDTTVRLVRLAVPARPSRPDIPSMQPAEPPQKMRL